MNKQDIIEKVKKISPNFKEVKEASFCMNGIETNTLIFEYEGSQIVFVDGKDNVELGWDYKDELDNSIIDFMKDYAKDYYEYLLEVEKDLIEYYENQIKEVLENGKSKEEIEQIKEDLQDELEFSNEEKDLYKDGNKFVDKFRSYLSESTSPVRNANIKPMLVEVESNFLKRDMTYDEVINELEKTPFRLPTEDEWEYICSGGKRTIFRWGNILNENLGKEIFEITPNTKVDFETIIDKPNMFGVFISYNPYQLEIIKDNPYSKGGDGGCSICGGEGPIYVLPCFSSFYRNQKSLHFNKNYYKIRRVVSLD